MKICGNFFLHQTLFNETPLKFSRRTHSILACRDSSIFDRTFNKSFDFCFKSAKTEKILISLHSYTCEGTTMKRMSLQNIYSCGSNKSPDPIKVPVGQHIQINKRPVLNKDVPNGQISKKNKCPGIL